MHAALSAGADSVSVGSSAEDSGGAGTVSVGSSAEGSVGAGVVSSAEVVSEEEVSVVSSFVASPDVAAGSVPGFFYPHPANDSSKSIANATAVSFFIFCLLLSHI